MGTAVTPQLVDVIDTVTAVRSYSSGISRHLRTCQEERWGLRTESPTPEDPFFDSEVTWLLPGMSLKLTQRRPRSRHARRVPSELTAVRVFHDGRYWRTTDLLLGLAVPGGCSSARIVRSEEFAAAVAGRVLLVNDADLALCTVHKTLEELSRQRHDLSSWLAYKHIFEVWPPF